MVAFGYIMLFCVENELFLSTSIWLPFFYAFLCGAVEAACLQTRSFLTLAVTITNVKLVSIT